MDGGRHCGWRHRQLNARHYNHTESEVDRRNGRPRQSCHRDGGTRWFCPVVAAGSGGAARSDGSGHLAIVARVSSDPAAASSNAAGEQLERIASAAYKLSSIQSAAKSMPIWRLSTWACSAPPSSAVKILIVLFFEPTASKSFWAFSTGTTLSFAPWVTRKGHVMFLATSFRVNFFAMATPSSAGSAPTTQRN